MATLTEMYKMGAVEEGQLGVLAKAVICAKLGCKADGQEVAFGNHTLRLTDSLPHSEQRQGRAVDVVKGVQQSRPTAANRGVVNKSGLTPKAPAPRQDVRTATQNAQTTRRGSPTSQPAQRPAADQRPATGQMGKDVGVAKTGAGTAGGKPGQKVERRAAKALPLLPFEEKTRTGQSARPATPQKSPAEQSAPPSYRRDVQERREASPPVAQRSATPNAFAPESVVKQEVRAGAVEHPRLDGLAEFVAKEAKVDVAVARAVLTGIVSYLSVYPSVGILRLIDDIVKKTKADQRVVRLAIEALRGIDYVDVVDGAVVNLKRR